MIRRLIEADFVQHQDRTTGERVGFWLREARTPELLVAVARRFPDSAAALMVDRPMLRLAVEDRQEALAGALEAEAAAEREADRPVLGPPCGRSSSACGTSAFDDPSRRVAFEYSGGDLALYF